MILKVPESVETPKISSNIPQNSDKTEMASKPFHKVHKNQKYLKHFPGL